MRRCPNSILNVVFLLSLTHSNFEASGKLANDVPVGSSVNLFCQQTNKRIVADKWDDDSDDYLLTLLCPPDEKYVMPSNEEFPRCKSWCPAKKPQPTKESGLVIKPVDNNKREYWEDEDLTYICKVPAKGLEASDQNEVVYKCIPDYPMGRYTAPRENTSETWPTCTDRTTTVAPRRRPFFSVTCLFVLNSLFTFISAMLAAIDKVLKRAADETTRIRTREIYVSERNQGDVNYFWGVTIPSLLGNVFTCPHKVFIVFIVFQSWSSLSCFVCAARGTTIHIVDIVRRELQNKMNYIDPKWYKCLWWLSKDYYSQDLRLWLVVSKN